MPHTARPTFFPFAAATLLAAFVTTTRAEAVQLGWETIQLPTVASYTINYVPLTLDLTKPAPVVVFLHGSGSGPEVWQQNTHIGQIAEELGFVLVMPCAGIGFNFGVGADDAIVAAALDATEQRLPIDRRRVGLAGFSAGAAYALVLAYAAPNNFTGVFAMAAPYRIVIHVTDPEHAPPARLLYGTLDPNYPLREVWVPMLERLGIATEVEIVPHLRHEVPPDESLRTGFGFLLSQPVETCVPTATALCLRGRFRVEAAWQTATAQGQVGVVQLTGESGYLWFFDPANVEVNVKLLDGCGVNGRYWFFAAGTTDVGVTFTVTDTASPTPQNVNNYSRPRGTAFQPLLDTAAFATCP